MGDFFGKDWDKLIWEYFKSHWKIPDQSNFVRQATNLYIIKRMLQENLATDLSVFGDI